MDIVRWLFGREPIEVYAKGYRGVLDDKGIRCWDAIQALVEFEGRAFCTFETSWIVPTSYTNVVDNRLSLYGQKGGLEIRNEPNLWAFTDRFHTPFSSESVTRYGKAWGFQYESIRYFIDCLADGVTPEVTGRDGLMVTAMIEATLLSLAERRPVAIAEVLETGRRAVR
jgi:predicted dehydrogenase